jgi:GntR family transcriptional repressor for pyruvate dehydrogenase complex
MTIGLTPIKPKRISDQVFDQIKDLITRGELSPGDQVSPERDLAKALNVSRTTVRDAISKLVAMRFLEHRQGQGTFVKYPDTGKGNLLAEAMALENATIKDLLEFRMGLECNAAAVAAQKATPEDIQHLGDAIRDMELALASGGLGTEADVAFHMTISYASKNPVQIHIMKHFFDFLFYGIKESRAALYRDPRQAGKMLAQHQQIFQAIKDRDQNQAHQAMQAHIQYVMDFILSSKQPL